jgi:hypothetical protein
MVGVMGLGLVLLGFVPTTALAAATGAAMGAAGGYSGVLLISWVQRRAPQVMLGRAMSVMMAAVAGLVPVSGMPPPLRAATCSRIPA